MKTNLLLINSMVCVLLMATVSANASVIIISNDSVIETFGEVSNSTKTSIDEGDSPYSDTSIPGFFDDNTESAIRVDGAQAIGDASMEVFMSSAPSVPLFIEMDMSVFASAESIDDDNKAFQSASSVLDISFITNEFYTFSFGAEFMTAGADEGFFDKAFVEVSLINSMGDSILDIFVAGDITSPFVTISPFESLLAPADEYRLLVTTSAEVFSIGADGFFSNEASGLMFFEITTAAVPVPATVFLFGSGLLGLVTFARRRV